MYLLSRLLDERGVSVAPLEDEEEEEEGQVQGVEVGKGVKEKEKEGKTTTTTTTTKTVTILTERGHDKGMNNNDNDNDIIGSKDVLSGMFNCRLCVSVFSREATNYSLEHVEAQVHTHIT